MASVAVFGHGDSLPATLPGGFVSIAINHAADTLQCDWIAALDHPRPLKDILPPHSGVITADCYVPDWKERLPGALILGHQWMVKPPWMRHIANSSVYALLFAQQVCKADDIHVWGVDMLGDTPRWNDERQRWSTLVAWLRKSGISVTEHGAHQTP